MNQFFMCLHTNEIGRLILVHYELLGRDSIRNASRPIRIYAATLLVGDVVTAEVHVFIIQTYTTPSR